MSDGKTRRRMNEREWQCFEDGVNWERERIIKLLESLKGTCDNDCDECRPYAERSAHYLTALQDLIKGEK